MLISGGFNIYPAELEAVLTNHPQVVEAAVSACRPRLGEVAVAFIARAWRAADGEELQAFCKPLLG